MSQPSTAARALDPLSPDEREQLLGLARQALEEGLLQGSLSPLNLDNLPPRLRDQGVVFVTLTIGEQLRGCIGELQASRPLAEDVRRHALAAALDDYRFSPICPEELPGIEIEISRLSPLAPLEYDCPDDLLTCLRPGVDGVVLFDGPRRATFLPQVWQKIPDPALFLSLLCQKMGAPPDMWRWKKLPVFIYQVEEFHE